MLLLRTGKVSGLGLHLRSIASEIEVADNEGPLEYEHEYYLLNRDKISELNRRYYLQHKHQIRDSQRIYRSLNKDKLIDHQRKTRVQHEVKMKAYDELYRALNKDKINHQSRRYYVLHKNKKKESDRLYYLANKRRIRQAQAQYYSQNEAAVKDSARLYRFVNNMSVKENARLYRAENRDRIRECQRSLLRQNQDRMRDYERVYRVENKDKIFESQRKIRLRNHPNAIFQRDLNKSWKTPALVRQYFDGYSHQLQINTFSDWYRVSRLQINNLGGSGIVRYGNIGDALKCAYPEIRWEQERFSVGGKKSEQRWLRLKIEELIPGIEIIEEFDHPDLTWEKSGRPVELDLWIPQFQIGLEYQGEQHYSNLNNAFGPNGTVGLYSERDVTKDTISQIRDITLIAIPYWYAFLTLGLNVRWDRGIKSLGATLYHARPDVFPLTDSEPIPIAVPCTFES